MKITKFKDIMDEIAYSWESNYEFRKDGKNFILNKLTIGPDFIEYKTWRNEITPEVYNDVKRFYIFLKSTER